MRFLKENKKYLIILFIVIFIVHSVISIRSADKLSQQKVKFLCEQAVIGSNFANLKEILNKDEYFIAGKDSFTKVEENKTDDLQTFVYLRLALLIDNVPRCRVKVGKSNNKIVLAEFYIGDILIFSKEE